MLFCHLVTTLAFLSLHKWKEAYLPDDNLSLSDYLFFKLNSKNELEQCISI